MLTNNRTDESERNLAKRPKFTLSTDTTRWDAFLETRRGFAVPQNSFGGEAFATPRDDVERSLSGGIAAPWGEIAAQSRATWGEIAAQPRATWGEIAAQPEANISLPWGEVTAEAKKQTTLAGRFALEILLGLGGVEEKTLIVEDGHRLAARSPYIREVIDTEIIKEQAANGKRRIRIDVVAVGSSFDGIASALDFALASEWSCGMDGYWRDYWRKYSKDPRQTIQPMAQAARCGEATQVEDALRTLEILFAASLLKLPRLEEAAEQRLVGSTDLAAGSLITCATVLPLLARTFGRIRNVSRACLRFLTSSEKRTAEVLDGRECQLGVIYATHPVVGTLLSGVFTGKKPQTNVDLNPVAFELLFGPGAAAR